MANLLRQGAIANLLGVSKQRAHQLARHVTFPPPVRQLGRAALWRLRERRLRAVPTCPNCGEDNPERARFCMACTAPLVALAAQGKRRTVTIVFSDLIGSTALGERLDAEALREVLDR